MDYAHTISLKWSRGGVPFLRDFKTAYSHDVRTGRMMHLTQRDAYVTSVENGHHTPNRTEFVYGLGETKGGLMKAGYRYTIDSRDSLGYDPEHTDPLYKICPFLLTHHVDSGVWYGVYYNSLVPASVDLGAEHDFSTGNFRSYAVENGPLDYYVLLGERVPDIVTQLAHLVTPCSAQDPVKWLASPTLPRRSELGYLASSLTLSEREDAQAAVVEYVRETRAHGFRLDGMHLSSGYCLDASSGERNYFIWNRDKYPDPAALGQEMEKELQCQVIINVKPWLLDGHPWYARTASEGAFVGAAPDAADRGEHGECKTIHWSSSMGQTARGSYIDFTSNGGCSAWSKLMQDGVLSKHISGMWIDNNEFSSLVDDAAQLAGDINPWTLPSQSAEEAQAEGAARMGPHGAVAAGAVGRQVLTMGMARATYVALMAAQPSLRPVIVTRSAVPGIQAYAHGTWSGDNATTWKTLRWSTKMTLSVGLSFGPGLYGHDIGGFAGDNSPSPELLLRWCQQGAWHTRFTVHSWKKVSTTLFMYEDSHPDITQMLRETLDLRYKLIPLLYSLYVSDYHRKGHPVLKPLLWFHGGDRHTLTQDEQFLVGSHILVAPVLERGAREVAFHLPHQLDGQAEPIRWCEMDTGKWHAPSPGKDTVTLAAPLFRCPVLVRENGMVLLDEGKGALVLRLFPRKGQGSFTLFHDDGETNAATHEGAFTEVHITSEADDESVSVHWEVRRAGYPVDWTFECVLPPGETRPLLAPGRERQAGQSPCSMRVRISVA